MIEVLYHYHQPVLFDNEKSKYLIQPDAAAFVNCLSSKFKVSLLAYINPNKNNGLNPNEENTKKSYLNKNIKILNLGLKPKKLLARYLFFLLNFKLIKTIRKKKFDYLYIEYPTPLSLLILLLLKYEKLAIFFAGDMEASIKMEQGVTLRYFLAKLNKNIFFKLSSFKKVKYLGENMCSTGSIYPKYDFFPMVNKKIIPILMNTFTNEQSLQRISKIKFKKKFENPFILFSINRLSYELGVSNLPKIAEILVEKKFQFKWYVIGDGPYEKFLKDDIKEKNLTKYFVFTGWQSHKEIEKLIYTYNPDLYIELPTYCGGGPARSAWEALSYGIPVVVGEYSRKEYLTNFRNIIYPKSNSPYEFSQQILKFFNLSPDEVKEMKINSANIALERTVDKEILRISENLN